MEPSVFQNLPIVLVVFGLMLAVAALGTRISSRIGIPTALGFIAVGMVVGTQTDLRERLLDFDTAYAVGNIALALILFHGGLGTDLRRTRGVWGPSIMLATVGVALPVLDPEEARVLRLVAVG